MADAKTVAEWMVEELNRVSYLDQEQAVFDIKTKFGDEFTYINDNGNLAIDRRVLREFRKLTSDDVIWDRTDRMWRKREDYDDPGRMQD